MSIRTPAPAQRERQSPPGAEARRSALPRLIAASAAYAAAELLAAVFLGGFFSLGRAEALLFFVFRAWLLLLSALLVLNWRSPERVGFYVLALLLAGLSESLFLIGLGAGDPWPEAARGLAAGAVLLIVIEGALRLGRRLVGRWGGAGAAAALAVLFLVPGLLAPYEAVVLGPARAKASGKQDLMLLTGLPLIWGETGPLDPNSRPAASYKALEEEFKIRPLDVLDSTSLGSGRLLLLAQPRALAPSELVALDDWVRRGGRALILTDPALLWPSELPRGDIRRAPAIGLLDPLLAHWGLRMEAPNAPAAVVEDVRSRRLALFAPGRFTSNSTSCTVGPASHIARCRLGRGSAILLGDADMMHDRLWVGPGEGGTRRYARISDNPLLVADWLDELAGRHRERAQGSVNWIGREARPVLALLLALLPILAAAAVTAILRLRRWT
jgi:hypothetical protein